MQVSHVVVPSKEHSKQSVIFPLHVLHVLLELKLKNKEKKFKPVPKSNPTAFIFASSLISITTT